MAIQDWGITYDELEPYYDKFEYMAGIAGKAGNLRARRSPAATSSRGRARASSRSRRRRTREIGALFRKAANELGYHPFSAPDREPARRRTRTRTGSTRGAVHLLRVLRAVRLRGRREGRPDRDRDPGRAEDRQVQDRSTTRTRSRSRTTARTRQSVLYYDAHGPRAGAAGRRDRARRVRLQQRAAAADVEARHAVRPGRPTRAPSARNYAYQTGGGGATGWFNDASSSATWARARMRSRSTTSTPTTSTTPALGFIGGGSITSGQSGARPIQSLSVAAGHAGVRARLEGGDPEVLQERRQRRLPGRVAGLPQHFLDLDPNYRDSSATR